MRKTFIPIVIILLITIACNFPGITAPSVSTISTVAYRFVTVDPNATVTPTPFLPGNSINSPLVPTPALPDALVTEVPTQTVEVIVPPPNVINVLVLGSDWRPNSGYRTDVIILLVFHPDSGDLSMVSFPRDLYVEIPGIGQERINISQQFGGFDLTSRTFEINFGIIPDFYVLTNFQGFVNIVNTVGGIQVEATRNLTDTCLLPQAINGYCSVGPGSVYMDGETALWYARSRYSTSDFDRTRRAQEVLTALFRKLFSLDAVNRTAELYNLFSYNIDTNLTLESAITLAKMAPGLYNNPEKIHRFAIGAQHVYSYQTPAGAQVLLPNFDAINQILYEAYHP